MSHSALANSADPDQILHSAASDLDLHCLPITLMGVSRLKWINACYIKNIAIINHVVNCFLYLLIEGEGPDQSV